MSLAMNFNLENSPSVAGVQSFLLRPFIMLLDSKNIYPFPRQISFLKLKSNDI